MSIVTEFCNRYGYIHHVLTGPVKIDEIIAAHKKSMEIPGIFPLTPVIWEFRNVKFSGESDILGRIRKVGFYLEQTQKKRELIYKVGLVTESDLIFALGRMFQSLADFKPEQFKLFRDMESALVWIQEE